MPYGVQCFFPVYDYALDPQSKLSSNSGAIIWLYLHLLTPVVIPYLHLDKHPATVGQLLSEQLLEAVLAHLF